ncbi:filamentous hemagglutinin N-terminal domain-containing protein, partial [Microbulbifer sp. OS29]
MKVKNKKLELRKLASAIKVSSFAYAGLFAGLISPMAHAGPEGGTVTGGSGTIDVNGTTTTVDQVTDLLSIDWDSFNLTEEELIQFLQPDSSSIVLNRILDQDVTTIQGAIEANGHVILVNPRGVLFTETATVNVGAITASGLDMSPEDFMNGNFAFKGESGSSGVVINRGVINASSAVLVGKQVTNASTGLISAELVSLAAADEALLTFDADGLIGLKVTKEVMENDLGLDSAVLNEGTIDGAQVLMEASVSGDLFTAAVNNEGTIKASGIDTSGGKIRLFGSGSGVVNSGTLDASGSTGGEVVLEGDFAEHSGDISVAADSGSGGDVAVLGDEVVVSGNIDARGTASGGEVLIGGDYQGNNEDVHNAETTMVTAEATIDASGVGDADGGTVIVWADDTTDFGGTIFAESGENGGDGGLVETSGKIYLNLDEDNMFVSTLSHGDGETGLWLLDPGWMEILDDCTGLSNCTTSGSIETALESTSIGISVTDSGDTEYGILVGNDIEWSENTTLTLTSFSGVTVDTGVNINATGNGNGDSESEAGGSLVINAGGAFTNSGSINVNTFTLTVGYESDVITGSDATANTLGDLTVRDSGTVTGNSDADSFLFSDDDDAISITGDNSFTLGVVSFTGIEGVDLGGGANSIAALGTTILNGVDNAAESNSIDFSNISSVTGGSLEGSDNADIFEVNSGTSVTANSISFSGLSGSIDAKGGTDTVTGADGEDWTLTGNDYEAENSGITFSNVDELTAVNANLVGTTSDDSFELLSDADVKVNNITISGMSAVDGNGSGGTGDHLNASAYSAGLALTGTDNQVTAESGALIFNNIDTAETTELIGSTGADSFTVTDTNAVTSYDIDFTSVSIISDAGNSDTVTGESGKDWELTANTNEVKSSEIIFTDIENINVSSSADLVGTTSAESFKLLSSGDIDVNGMIFSDMKRVLGDGGGATKDEDNLDASEYAGGLTLTDAIGKIETDSLIFKNIATATAVELTGHSGTDTLTITGTNTLDHAQSEISFSGVSTVNADSGDDTVAVIDTVTLTETNNKAISSDITFSEIEFINYASDDGGSFSLVGSATDDTFEVVSAAEIIANAISVTGFSSTIDAAGSGDTDSVTGTSGEDWTLTGNNYEATNNGITFSNVETLTATNASLLGTSSADAFVLQSDADVAIYNMTISGMSAVDGNGGDDSLDASAYNDGLALTGANNQVTAESGALTFDGIVSAVTSALTGTSGADSFTVNGDNAATSYDIAFTGLSTVDAASGTDSVTGADGADWTLAGTDNEAVNSSITFSDVNTLTAVNADLIGTTSADAFVLQSGGDVEAYAMTVSGMSAVDGNGGDDSLEASAYSDGLALTGTNNQVTAESGALTFDGIVS